MGGIRDSGPGPCCCILEVGSALTEPKTNEGPTQTLLVAALLSACAGLLDAFVYLNHGHVFASAVTGNGVLLGIAMIHADWVEVLRHAAPLVFFLVGVTASRLMQRRLGRSAATVGVVLEMLVLGLATRLPMSFPEMAFTSLMAFVTSYQVSGFRTVDDLPFSSTYIAGDLRTVADGLFEMLSPGTRGAGWRKIRDLSQVVGAFVLGAAAGSELAPRFLNRTLWFAEPMLLVVLVSCIGELRGGGAGEHRV